MNNIGFILNEENKNQLSNVCQQIIICPDGKTVAQTIKKAIISNPNSEFYIYSLMELEMQLVQYYTIFSLLQEQNKILHIVEKGELSQYSDRELFFILRQIAVLENEVISGRTIRGIERAKKDGIFLGRPKLDSKKINQIQRLYSRRNKTLKEIADLCNVSVGTVYKYAKTT